jgi:cobalt-zinc-cadmium efflux system outer membrane protein
VAALLFAIAAGVQVGADEGPPLTLEQAIELAMSANQTLAAARMGRQVAQAGVDIAGQRPNPELTIEAERETPHESYTLAFPVETAGKRRRRIELSEAAAGSNEAELARLTAEIRGAVRRAFYTLSAARQRVVEMEEVARLAERTRDAAKDRYDSGAAPRLELLQAELTLGETTNDLDAARAQMASARIDLNTLMARSPEEPTSAAGDLGAGEVPARQPAMDLAMSASTDLALLDHRIAEAQARVGLARAGRVPDVVLQGALTRRSEPEFETGWRAGASVSLPVLSQHRGEVRLEERTFDQLQAEREAVMARIRGSVSAAVVVASAQRERYAHYHDRILPQAAEVEQMAAESYRAGRTGLVTMLQAFASARDIRLKSVEAGLDYQIALADLERAIGAPLR